MQNQHISQTQAQDEIDLIELIGILWRKKIWILVSTLICTLIVGVYAFTAKEQWTSKSNVIAPKVVDEQQYLNIRQEYARILKIDFDPTSITNELFSSFSRLSTSNVEKKAFFISSELYKKLSDGLDEQQKRKLLDELMNKQLISEKPDLKKTPNAIGLNISFSAETPMDAQDILAQFVNFIDDKAYNLVKQDFLVFLNAKIQDLHYEQQQIEYESDNQKKVQLENLEKAYLIAKKAGIQEYTKTSSNLEMAQSFMLSETKIPLSDSKLSDGNYLFMLGQKYLQAQLDTIKENKIIYPVRYYQITKQLNELEQLLTKIELAKAHSYSYHSEPDYPVQRDWPKRLLLIALGLVVGFLSSSVYILVRILLVNKERKSA